MRRFLICLLVCLVAGSASAQAPYVIPDETGFLLGVGYTRSTGGSDINTFSLEGVATLRPTVDLSVGVASANRVGTSSVRTAGLAGTVYLVSGPDLWLGPTVGVSVVDIFSGRDVGVQVTGGAVAAGRWAVGAVDLVPQGAVVLGTPLTDRTADDPFVAISAGVGIRFVSREDLVLVLEPSVGHTFLDNRNGITVVGGSLRFRRLR